MRKTLPSLGRASIYDRASCLPCASAQGRSPLCTPAAGSFLCKVGGRASSLHGRASSTHDRAYRRQRLHCARLGLPQHTTVTPLRARWAILCTVETHRHIAGPPLRTTGSPLNTERPPLNTAGPSLNSAGPPLVRTGPPLNTAGPPLNTTGPPLNTTGSPLNITGLPLNTAGPPLNMAGPPYDRVYS